MTELSREILERWQVRNTKKQKAAFREFLQSRLPGLTVEEGGLARSKNLVLGDPDTAQVVFSAHYDTCTTLPFPNFLTPKNIPLYILYNLLICVVLFLAVGLTSFLTARLTHSPLAAYFISLAVCFLVLLLFFAGKPNPHTANDNTSGVIALCEIYDALTEEQRKKAALVFFDNEELGLLGSRQFLKRHKAAMGQTLLINLDCVSDGDQLMMIWNKAAQKEWEAPLKAAFTAEVPAGKTVLWERASRTLYPSDQVGFPCYAAVAAFRKKKFLGLYMSRIHTKKDTVFEEENILWLRQSARRLADALSGQESGTPCPEFERA